MLDHRVFRVFKVSVVILDQKEIQGVKDQKEILDHKDQQDQ